MHIISYKKIREFCQKHPQALSPLGNWYRIVKSENFRSFDDVRRLFPSADRVGNFLIFNIGGNNYRLIAYISYSAGQVFIRQILTHNEYDREKWKQDQWFRNTNA